MNRPLPIEITLLSSSIRSPDRCVRRRSPATSGLSGTVTSRPWRAVTIVSSVVTMTSRPVVAVTRMLP